MFYTLFLQPEYYGPMSMRKSRRRVDALNILYGNCLRNCDIPFPGPRYVTGSEVLGDTRAPRPSLTTVRQRYVRIIRATDVRGQDTCLLILTMA